jgi:hypothetical protein
VKLLFTFSFFYIFLDNLLNLVKGNFYDFLTVVNVINFYDYLLRAFWGFSGNIEKKNLITGSALFSRIRTPNTTLISELCTVAKLFLKKLVLFHFSCIIFSVPDLFSAYKTRGSHRFLKSTWEKEKLNLLRAHKKVVKFWWFWKLSSMSEKSKETSINYAAHFLIFFFRFIPLYSYVQKWPLGVFLATGFETFNVNILGWNLEHVFVRSKSRSIFFFGRQHLWSHL